MVAELGSGLVHGWTRRQLTAGLTTGWLVLLLQAGNQSDDPELFPGRAMQQQGLTAREMVLAMGLKANGDLIQVLS